MFSPLGTLATNYVAAFAWISPVQATAAVAAAIYALAGLVAVRALAEHSRPPAQPSRSHPPLKAAA